jgi:hypothetical protein
MKKLCRRPTGSKAIQFSQNWKTNAFPLKAKPQKILPTKTKWLLNLTPKIIQILKTLEFYYFRKIKRGEKVGMEARK